MKFVRKKGKFQTDFPGTENKAYIHRVNHTPHDTLIINQTVNWIRSVVIGCNFCPFAAKAMKQKSIRYIVLTSDNKEAYLKSLLTEFRYLDENELTETVFIIFPEHFEGFTEYLAMAAAADKFLSKKKYEGIYQLASFHPLYLFAGSTDEDAANYTNRSPYPMLHILREKSITKALDNFSSAGNIPGANVNFARAKGLEYMSLLKAACME